MSAAFLQKGKRKKCIPYCTECVTSRVLNDEKAKTISNVFVKVLLLWVSC